MTTVDSDAPGNASVRAGTITDPTTTAEAIKDKTPAAPMRRRIGDENIKKPFSGFAAQARNCLLQKAVQQTC
ncbi:MAG: hypothetical protein ACI8RE_001390 [Ilumatobacter sp.]|jgi:hypothetical protein